MIRAAFNAQVLLEHWPDSAFSNAEVPLEHSPAALLQHSGLIPPFLTLKCRWSTFQQHFFSIQPRFSKFQRSSAAGALSSSTCLAFWPDSAFSNAEVPLEHSPAALLQHSGLIPPFLTLKCCWSTLQQHMFSTCLSAKDFCPCWIIEAV